MASIAVFVYPQRIGIARIKSPGFRPCYAAPQWQNMDNVDQLLAEPVLLANHIREMLGDTKPCDVFVAVHPGAYRAVMFSYDKKRRGDLNRLRQSELETVFRGEVGKMYTYDLLLDKGRPNAAGRSRRIIYAIEKVRVTMMKEAFAAQKLNLKRIAPMDVAAAEAAAKFWAPKDKTISVCMVVDEACASISFVKDGVIHALRTLPDGFATVVSNYMEIAGVGRDQAIAEIKENGIHVTDEDFDMPVIQDDMLRTVTRLTVEVVKTLHNTFGEEATLGHVLVCGNFVGTTGLMEYLDTMLHTQCVEATAENLGSNTTAAIVLEDALLPELFFLGTATASGSDLMYQLKKEKSDRNSSILVCSAMTLAVAGLMAVTPLMKHNLVAQRDAISARMELPEYQAVAGLMDEKSQLTRHKANLTAAIEALPHGATNTAGMLDDLLALTGEYGTVLSIATDYSGKTIRISFTTANYDSYIYWQKKVVEDGRFSFLEVPPFSGNGLIYTVEANLTATDFDAPAPTEATEGEG